MIAKKLKPPRDLAGYDPVSTAGDCWFDPDEAQRHVEFFPRFLCHVKGKIAGQPFELNPWERDFIITLMGWKRPDGTRRYREAFVAIPRKNDKTTLCAGLSLDFLLCDDEEGAEIYTAAADRDMATLCFDPASKMVAKNHKLATMCTVIDSTKRIKLPHRNSFLRAIPADAAGSHGFNAHAVIIDELHTQPNRNLYDVLRTSTAARRQPCIVSITTAGHDKESICYELWDYGHKIRDGEIEDPYFLPVIYEATDKDDWKDRDVWKRVNPNYGRSVSPEYLEEAFQRALKTPSFENTFKNLHLNIWTEAETRWINSEDWDNCKGEFPDLKGHKCIAGLDLGSTDDMTALVYVFPVDGKYYVVPHLFCPADTIGSGRYRYHAQYHVWERAGWITRTPGATTDYEFVRQRIRDDAERYDIAEIIFDQTQAMDTHNILSQEGFELAKISQTASALYGGVKATEEAILSGNLVHDGNEVLKWMMASTVLVTDSMDRKRPDKKKSMGEHGTKGKIDGVVALVMAMTRATLTDEGSVYDERGVLSI